MLVFFLSVFLSGSFVVFKNFQIIVIKQKKNTKILVLGILWLFNNLKKAKYDLRM